EETEVRPAVGEPGDVAKDLAAEAGAGRLVLRLVAGDPLTQPAVVSEANEVSKTGAVFDVVPGVAPGTAVPAYAGAALGGTHTEIDARSDVDWAAVAAAPQPLVLHASSNHLAEAAAELMGHGMDGTTPVAVTSNGTINT